MAGGPYSGSEAKSGLEAKKAAIPDSAAWYS
jgi:hypothetical protein